MSIEESIIKLLSSNGILAFAEEQEGKHEEYVLVIKNDAGELNFLARSNIFLQCHSVSLYKASLFSERVKSIMRDLIKLDFVTSCEVENSYPETKESTKQYRYILEYLINYYV